MSLADAGASGYSNIVRKFGRVEMPAAGEAILWDGANGYRGWLDSEDDIEAVSTSVNDAPGQSGAYVLQVIGQGNDGIEKTEIVLLAGQVPVTLPSKFKTIYTAQIINPSGDNISPLVSGGVANNGQITIRSKSVPLDVMAILLPNLGRTQMMIWRCPKDHYAEFNKVSIYPISGKPVLVKLMARDTDTHSWVCLGQIDADADIPSITFPFPEYVSPGTDICLVITTEQTNSVASAQMWIEKKKIRNYEQLLAEESA